MIKARRVFLVSHGSSDPRSWQGLQNLVQTVQVAYPHWQVGGGCLEGQDQSLAAQLVAFSQVSSPDPQTKSLENNENKIYVMPLFLLAGVHTTVDIPAQVQEAQAKLLPTIDLEILPHLGAHPDLPQIRSDIFQQGEQKCRHIPTHKTQTTPQRLLLAHGSRRESANAGIMALAAKVSASAGFWAAAPFWEDLLNQWHNEGITQVLILPYFLLAGGITEIIASKVNTNQLNTNQADVSQVNDSHPWAAMHLELLPLPFSAATIIRLLNAIT